MAGIFNERFETTFGRFGVLAIIDLLLMHLSCMEYLSKAWMESRHRVAVEV